MSILILQTEIDRLRKDLSYQTSIRERAEARCEELTTSNRLADGAINELRALLDRERAWNKEQEIDRVKLRLENEELRKELRTLRGDG